MGARATIADMGEPDIQEFRRGRLSDAIDFASGGDRSAFGRKLGYKDGAFVRQMLSGTRAISEKTVRAIEALPGMNGWFASKTTTVTKNQRVEALHDLAAAELWASYQRADRAAQLVADLAIGRQTHIQDHALRQSVQAAIAVAAASFPAPKHPAKKRAGSALS